MNIYTRSYTLAIASTSLPQGCCGDMRGSPGDRTQIQGLRSKNDSEPRTIILKYKMTSATKQRLH